MATIASRASRVRPTFASLFGDKQTLIVYSFMYGSEMEQACSMCTACSARSTATRATSNSASRLPSSPIGRLTAYKRKRGWQALRLYSNRNDAYSRNYFGVLPDGSDIPAFNVFTRRDGTVRHFWAGEMTDTSADPGQDPRGAPDLVPLWNRLDTTPESRGTDWYPALRYEP